MAKRSETTLFFRPFEIATDMIRTQDPGVLRSPLTRLLKLRKHGDYPMGSLENKERQVAYWRIQQTDLFYTASILPSLQVDQVLRTVNERYCPERRFAFVKPDEKGNYSIHYGFHEDNPELASKGGYTKTLGELANEVSGLLMEFAKEIGLKLKVTG